MQQFDQARIADVPTSHGAALQAQIGAKPGNPREGRGRWMRAFHRRAALALLAAGLLLTVPGVPVQAQEGETADAAASTRPLVGVGLVVGLSGMGDSVVDQRVVDASIVGVLKRAGLEPWSDQIKPGHLAVVMISAELPDGSRDGAKIDVSVSAIGDARSIVGGTLLVAPLRDADGVVHAVGRGLISPDASSSGTVQAADLRVAEIADGAVIERLRQMQNYAQFLPRVTLD